VTSSPACPGFAGPQSHHARHDGRSLVFDTESLLKPESDEIPHTPTPAHN